MHHTRTTHRPMLTHMLAWHTGLRICIIFNAVVEEPLAAAMLRTGSYSTFMSSYILASSKRCVRAHIHTGTYTFVFVYVQVDDALGAEEMVEKLTDKNLQLEERIEGLEETVADLEALRDIAEEQEELRVELEHDMREELDMQLNKTREVGKGV